MSRIRLLREIGGGALKQICKVVLAFMPPKKEKHGNETHWNEVSFGISSVKDP
jgi:hypothetical protein